MSAARRLVSIVGLLFITASSAEATVGVRGNLPDTAVDLRCRIGTGLAVGVALGVRDDRVGRAPIPNSSPCGSAAIAFGHPGFAGLTSKLSTIVICFVAGVLVTNSRTDQRESVFGSSRTSSVTVTTSCS